MKVPALVPALVLVVGAAGCGGSSDTDAREPVTTRMSMPPPAAASCAAAVEWRDTLYFGTSADRPVTLGARLGDGSVPPCNDMPGSESGSGSPIEIVSVEGVPEEVAVATPGNNSMFYVAPGFFPQLPGTALHDLSYGAASDRPDERGTACEEAGLADLRATVRSAIFGYLVTELVDPPEGLPRETPIFVDAQTVVTGGGAMPHVDPGDSIGAQVLVCRKPHDRHFLKLVASRLTLRGP